MSDRRVPKVFICYRHKDTQGFAKSLYDALAGHFGADNVFRDYNTTKAGTDYVEFIDRKIKWCDVLLVMVGQHWRSGSGKDKTRPEGAIDWVRVEIAGALKRGIPIIPLLIEDASLPTEENLADDVKKLARLQPFELRDDPKWASDIQQLIEDIEQKVNPSDESASDIPASEKKSAARNYFNGLLGGAFAGLISGLIFGGLYYQSNHDKITPWRIPLTGVFGLFVGAIATLFINLGMALSSKLLKGSLYSKLPGSFVGGLLAGIVAAFVGGALSNGVEGNPINTKQLWAILFSPIAIALGILVRDMKQTWERVSVMIVILSIVIIVTVIAGNWLLPDDDALKRYFKAAPSDQITSSQDNTNRITGNEIKGVLVLGLVFGSISGLQVGLTVVSYDSLKDFLRSL